MIILWLGSPQHKTCVKGAQHRGIGHHCLRQFCRSETSMHMRALEGKVGEMAVTERVSLKMILITFDYIICLYVFVDFVFHPGLTYSV